MSEKRKADSASDSVKRQELAPIVLKLTRAATFAQILQSIGAFTKDKASGVKRTTNDVKIRVDEKNTWMSCVTTCGTMLGTFKLGSGLFTSYACDRTVVFDIRVDGVLAHLKLMDPQKELVITGRSYQVTASRIETTMHLKGKALSRPGAVEYDVQQCTVEAETLEMPDALADCSVHFPVDVFSKNVTTLHSIGCESLIIRVNAGCDIAAASAEGPVKISYETTGNADGL